MYKIEHDLTIRRLVDARRRNAAKENNFRESLLLMWRFCFMLVVGGMQMLAIRGLFSTDVKNDQDHVDENQGGGLSNLAPQVVQFYPLSEGGCFPE